MNSPTIRNVPKLQVGEAIKPQLAVQNRNKNTFHYEAKYHRELPHIVKFSGGRTSGMLLFILLEAGVLKAERGDVVVFNNTSAEHPKTYDFVRQCKQVVEQKYGLPFFFVEFQTYEDARNGSYCRLPTFRLVNSDPYGLRKNPHGYRHKGEVFEELLSWKGYLPTFFQRICTQSLKLETTRAFLKQWLANNEGTERLGHFGKESRISPDDAYELHRKYRGDTPKEIFAKKKEFLQECPTARPAQLWADYSSAVQEKTLRRNDGFANGGMEYLSFIGLRNDEMRRVAKVRRRNAGEEGSISYEDEHIYMPLASMGITTDHVTEFWKDQDWDLQLDPDQNLSNCVFCFLKGTNHLLQVKEALAGRGSKSLEDTPCDIRWWVGQEKKYGRNLKAEKREIRTEVAGNFIGFFGTGTQMSYETLEKTDGKDLHATMTNSLPCDCTD